MNLNQFISDAFPEGISYEDAAILCLRLFCSLDMIPEGLHSECNKDGLAEEFAQLYMDGKIFGPTNSSVSYGANFHSCSEKGHWIEVLASIFKKSVTYDESRAKELIEKLKQSNIESGV